MEIKNEGVLESSLIRSLIKPLKNMIFKFMHIKTLIIILAISSK
jgi:hypothetical protein